MMGAERLDNSGVPLDWLLQPWLASVSLPKLKVSDLRLDSREVCPGDLFVALAGHNAHGLKFAEQAIARGCAAILFDPAGNGQWLARQNDSVPCLPLVNLDRVLGPIADRFFDEPSLRLRVIGITGTNGKTSCSHFLARALADERPAAVVGTLGNGLPDHLSAATHTTPDAIATHRLLADFVEHGYGSVAMEASSHGLVQGRLNGVRFEGAVFTNISRDHLDYHGSMEAYLAAKLRLLDWPGLAFVVFNADDPIGDAVRTAVSADLAVYGFSLARNPAAALHLGAIRQETQGIRCTAQFDGQSVELSAPVFGYFNVENLAAVMTVLLAMGFSLEAAAERCGRVRPVPGRMEAFSASGISAIVDYAHTPDALETVLKGLRSHCRGRLWVVFGCGGDRDRGKRPQMGTIAARLADRLVLTDDNPRSEDGGSIIEEILAGIGEDANAAAVIRDRRSAIAYALNHAEPGDVVLVAGKGHETTQDVGGVKSHFSDREVVPELLAARGAT